MTTRSITLPIDQWQIIQTALENYYDKGPPSEQWKSNQLSSAAAALDVALAQPAPQGPTDEELLDWASYYGIDYVDAHRPSELDVEKAPVRSDELCIFARTILQCWSGPAIKPVPVAERLPGPEDCIRRADDDWCWGQERSLLTGQAAARWRLMRVSALTEEAVTWLPHHALPVPTLNPENHHD
jgi:hypothetical protein